MEKRPFVSVVIPSYNRSGFVLKAVKSALSQNFSDFEVLVCDDGSTDDTEEEVGFISDERVRYLKQENKGPGAARNLGIRNAKGEIIAFLDSDDEWLADHLKEIVEFFNLYPEADLVYTQNEVISSFEKKKHRRYYKKLEIPFVERKKDFRLYQGSVFDYYLEGHVLNQTSCTAVRKKVFDETGGFDENIYNGQDYEMWLRISNRFRIGVVKKVSVRYFFHEKSISRTVSREKHLKNRLKIFESVLERCDLDDGQKRIVENNIKNISEELSKL